MSKRTALLTALLLSACTAGVPEGAIHVSGLTRSETGAAYTVELFVEESVAPRTLDLLHGAIVVQPDERVPEGYTSAGAADALGIEIYDPDGDPAEGAVIATADALEAEELHRLLESEDKYLSRARPR